MRRTQIVAKISAKVTITFPLAELDNLKQALALWVGAAPNAQARLERLRFQVRILEGEDLW